MQIIELFDFIKIFSADLIILIELQKFTLKDFCHSFMSAISFIFLPFPTLQTKISNCL